MGARSIERSEVMLQRGSVLPDIGFGLLQPFDRSRP
jgi:hypothetical protein